MAPKVRSPSPYRAPSQSTARFYRLPSPVRRLVAISAGAVLLETSRRGGREGRSYVFVDPVRTWSAHARGDLPELFGAIEDALAEGLYAAGYLGYECGYHFEPTALAAVGSSADADFADPNPEHDGLPLAWFGFYRDPLIFDHSTGSFNRDFVPPAASGSQLAEADGVPELALTEAEYAGQVARIKRLIEEGDTYQANLTTRLRVAGLTDVSAAFGQMMAAQPVEYGALLSLGGSHVLSASPELFFRRHGDEIEMRPMKGTTGRGLSSAEDRDRALWLSRDPKNRSENVMIVDLLRSDLGRVCRMGSVAVEELFTVERFPTVFQMTSTVRGVLRPGLGYYDLFRAIFPSGSIVGAPKIRTMQILREIEKRDRGVYTGSIGYLAPGGSATFSVAIRTLVLQDGRGEMGVGSGVVYDSDAAAEYEECRSKATFLTLDTTPFQLIETMLWEEGYAFGEEHIERLAASAEYFDFVLDRERVRAALAVEARGFEVGCRYRVRLLMDSDGSVEVSSIEIADDQAAEVDVMLASGRLSSKDGFLRHKTTRRGVYDTAFREALRLGFADAIFRNEHGMVTEGAIHNVVVVKDGVWKTPRLSAGVLPGIFRAHLIGSRGVVEAEIGIADLAEADEVYLCNSVRGLRRVRRVDFTRVGAQKSR